jgi:hypothetical protein
MRQRLDPASVRCVGELHITVTDVHGTVAHYVVVNLTTVAGKSLVRDLLHGDAVAGVSHFAVGTGSTAPSAADTALVTEVFRAAVTSKTKGSGSLTIKYFLGTASANGSTLREAGLFNAATAGTLYARALVTPDIVKTASIAVTFQWVLTFI